jgi:hypothetical protein
VRADFDSREGLDLVQEEAPRLARGVFLREPVDLVHGVLPGGRMRALREERRQLLSFCPRFRDDAVAAEAFDLALRVRDAVAEAVHRGGDLERDIGISLASSLEDRDERRVVLGPQGIELLRHVRDGGLREIAARAARVAEDHHGAAVGHAVLRDVEEARRPVRNVLLGIGRGLAVGAHVGPEEREVACRDQRSCRSAMNCHRGRGARLGGCPGLRLLLEHVAKSFVEDRDLTALAPPFRSKRRAPS